MIKRIIKTISKLYVVITQSERNMYVKCQIQTYTLKLNDSRKDGRVTVMIKQLDYNPLARIYVKNEDQDSAKNILVFEESSIVVDLYISTMQLP